MNVYQLLSANWLTIYRNLWTLAIVMVLATVLGPWKFKGHLLEWARETIDSLRHLAAAVKHAWQRYRDPKMAVAEDAVQEYCAVIMAVEVVEALRQSPDLDKASRQVAKQASAILDDSEVFRKKAQTHLATMSDITIGYVAAAMAKEASLAIETCTTFLEQERRDALLERCNVTTHLARRRLLS